VNSDVDDFPPRSPVMVLPSEMTPRAADSMLSATELRFTERSGTSDVDDDRGGERGYMAEGGAMANSKINEKEGR
jgi:hypothetical protein